MTDEILLGSHVSIAGGLIGAAVEAKSYGANVFMIYTGAPQNTVRKPIEQMKVAEGHEYMKKEGMVGFVVHAPYIINLASPKAETYDLAVSFLKKEVERTALLGSNYLVLHPGAFTERDVDYGISRIVEGLNKVIFDSENVIICLETMSGKGSEIGRSFEELQRIIESVENPERVAVCFDTCHTHDYGYDIVGDLDGVMKEFDRVVGLDKIKVFHLNGSLNERGIKKDRHANIGAGESNLKGVDKIGFNAICELVHSDYAKGRFLILETPWISEKENLYKQEIAALREGKQ